MYADDLQVGQKFLNKETRTICEVVEVEDGCKVFANDFGIWNYLDEDLFIEI